MQTIVNSAGRFTAPGPSLSPARQLRLYAEAAAWARFAANIPQRREAAQARAVRALRFSLAWNLLDLHVPAKLADVGRFQHVVRRLARHPAHAWPALHIERAHDDRLMVCCTHGVLGQLPRFHASWWRRLPEPRPQPWFLRVSTPSGAVDARGVNIALPWPGHLVACSAAVRQEPVGSPGGSPAPLALAA